MTDPGMRRFDEEPEAAAVTTLLARCAAPAWAERVARGRPYPDRVALLTASDAALAALRWDEVLAALAAHPRIGAPRDAVSRREQAASAEAGEAARTELIGLGRAYEARFGHVFLICATGLSADAMLESLRTRLGNDVDEERRVVRAELRKITRLRLEKLLEDA
ncbi:MAG: 2-oxo-4-hydroxy-4-carboxy-5-ureidoimidazoline decarboxylase [Streptosporangiales bacterium]|nr:2-oxo-4-hydroxy-4-carboxy-5-ureidoimidazoline decarboxylase [Streptosporangiales bacterium]